MIRLAQVKVYPVKGDLKANHRRLMGILEEIAHHQPDVVVTPECFLDGYIATEDVISRENILDYAIDPMNSPYVTEIAQYASANHVWCVVGCTRATSDGAYNTALVIDRAGHLAGMYDKIHCQMHDKKFLAGQRLPVFQSDFGLFGVMICADRRWPETVRSLALQGARVIFNPTYGMHGELNLHMMQTRSYESEVFIAFTHPGQALVTGPSGQVIGNDVAESSTYAMSEIDLSQVDTLRATGQSHLQDRRPDIYTR